MTTKTDFLGQHAPLHGIYGEKDCCLCRLERENAQLKTDLHDSTLQLEQDNADIVELRAENDEARVAMKEIAIGQGAFNRDPLIHASNVIEHSKEIAAAFLKAHPERK